MFDGYLGGTRASIAEETPRARRGASLGVHECYRGRGSTV